MKLDISRMSRILPILSILILGGFQTTNAMEYLITSSLGGTIPTADITYEQNTGIITVQTFIYMKYTSAEISSKGTGFTSGSLKYSTNQTNAILNGTPGSGTNQPGVYTIQNVNTDGTTTGNWNGTTPITGSLSADKQAVTATYTGRLDGNLYGAASTNYLYLATATLTINTATAGIINVSAVATTAWKGNAGTNFTTPISDSFLITVNAVPEPTTYALAALSCVALGVVGRRKTLKAKKQETASA
jgi:hypothetical protein